MTSKRHFAAKDGWQRINPLNFFLSAQVKSFSNLTDNTMNHGMNLFSMAARSPDEIKVDEDNQLQSVTKDVLVRNGNGTCSLLTISIRPTGSEVWSQEKPRKALCMGVMGPYGMVSLGKMDEQGEGERDPLGVGDSDVEWLEGFKREMKHKEAVLGMADPNLPDPDVAERIRERDRRRKRHCLAEIRRRRTQKMRDMFDHFVLREHLKAEARRVAQEHRARIENSQSSPSSDVRLRSPEEDSDSPAMACIKQDPECVDSFLVVDPLNTVSDHV